ncbi:MAG: GspE/PulE family protein [Candidatus Omnitrophota bacterium]
MTQDTRFQFISKLLEEKGVLTKDKIDDFWQKFKSNIPKTQEALEEFLIEKKLVTEKNLLDAYSQYLGMLHQDLESVQIPPEVLALIPAKFANRNKVIAIEKKDSSLVVAIRNPFDINVLDELKILTKLKIIPILSRAGSIEKAIQTHYGLGAETVETLVADAQQISAPESSPDELVIKQSSDDLEKMSEDASIINYVNQIIHDAYKRRATDIHIEPFETTLRIRYRIDGVLQEVKTSPDIKKLQLFIISRLKIMANLNIAQRRVPQDGRAKLKLPEEEIDLRLSTFPTLFGEGVSVRILSKKMIVFGLDQLGFPDNKVEELKNILKKPNGIVLVTGPTGCGKTTTLYACLNYINDSQVNIITLEDPVEYQLMGINQIQINTAIDLTFANGLRSILRQDPDIIMVGEIRDLETAQISIRAALTGHLIFSTLHTNNAIATITRLMDIGIESYLVAGTVKAVVAQRLVRTICLKCKTKYHPDKGILKLLEINTGKIKDNTVLYKGKGCKECAHTGYQGRTGIYEILVVNENISECIISEASKEKLKNEALKNSMVTLRMDGFEKVKQGITTVDEVLRVTEES